MADQHNTGMLITSNNIVDDIADLEETLEYHKDMFENFIQDYSDTVAANKYPLILGNSGATDLVQVEEGADDDTVRFDIGSAEQVIIENGAIKPTTDNDIDLGGSSNEFKNLYIDGTANIDELHQSSAMRPVGGSNTFLRPTNGVAANSVFMLGESTTIAWFYLNAAPPGWKALSTGADMVLGLSGGAAAYNVNGGNPDSVATWTISGLSTAAHTHTLIRDSNRSSASGPYIMNGANTGPQSNSTTTSDGTWRPAASVGKLFQLDTV